MRSFQKGLVYQSEEQGLYLEGSGRPLEFRRCVSGRFGLPGSSCEAEFAGERWARVIPKSAAQLFPFPSSRSPSEGRLRPLGARYTGNTPSQILHLFEMETGLPGHTPGTCSPHPAGSGKTTHSSPGGVRGLCHCLLPLPPSLRGPPSTIPQMPPSFLLFTSLFSSPKVPATQPGLPAVLTQDSDNSLQVLFSIAVQASSPGPPCPCPSRSQPRDLWDSAGLIHVPSASHSASLSRPPAAPSLRPQTVRPPDPQISTITSFYSRPLAPFRLIQVLDILTTRSRFRCWPGPRTSTARQTVCLLLPNSTEAFPKLPGMVSPPIHSQAPLGPRLPVLTPQATWSPTLVKTAGTARALLSFPSLTLNSRSLPRTTFSPHSPFLVNSSEPDKQETGLRSHSHPSPLPHPLHLRQILLDQPVDHPQTQGWLTSLLLLTWPMESVPDCPLCFRSLPPTTSAGFTQ